MSERMWSDDEISLLAVGTTLLRRRRRIVVWIVFALTFAILSLLGGAQVFRASVSFLPSGTEPARNGLATLAGQFGVSLPTSSLTLSPEAYARLLKSPSILRRIVRDTFAVPELSMRRASFLELFEFDGPATPLQEEEAMKLLAGIVRPTVVKATGLVEVSVATRWPNVSLAIVNALVEGVNDYNRRTRQGHAALERKFTDERVIVAAEQLHNAEESLVSFERTNRQIENSPALIVERERLQRFVSLQQQVYTSLLQASEDVRIREVRDTPLIVIFDPPAVAARPEPRGIPGKLILGLVLGGLLGVIHSLMPLVFERLGRERRSETVEFMVALGEARGDLRKPFRWLKARNVGKLPPG